MKIFFRKFQMRPIEVSTTPCWTSLFLTPCSDKDLVIVVGGVLHQTQSQSLPIKGSETWSMLANEKPWNLSHGSQLEALKPEPLRVLSLLLKPKFLSRSASNGKIETGSLSYIDTY